MAVPKVELSIIIGTVCFFNLSRIRQRSREMFHIIHVSG